MFKMAAFISALAMLGAASPAISAPNPDEFRKQVDRFVTAEMETEKVPGAAIAVLHNGEIIVAKGFGKANIEHDVPVARDTIFQLGSVGKMFTAATVLLEVEQGSMKLDDPISKYLGDVPASWRPITIRHILTHTSGIPNYRTDFDLQRNYSDDELVALARSLPLDFAPGARWKYSDRAYALLGIIVKKTAGKSYQDILHSQVFQPLGMKTARGISDRDIVLHRAAGYESVDGVLKNQDWVSPTLNATADGSLYMSLDDMIAWARGVEKGAVLSGDSWKQTYTAVRLNSGKTYPYGFGWFVEEAGGAPRYQHSGGWQGFSTYYARYLGDDLSIIFLSNSASADGDNFVDGIAGLWDPALVAPAPRPAPEPDVTRRLTAAIAAARQGNLVKRDIPLDSVDPDDLTNKHFAETFKDIGPLTKLELVDRRGMGDDIIYIYTATFGDQATTIEFGLAPGGYVSVLRIDR